MRRVNFRFGRKNRRGETLGLVGSFNSSLARRAFSSSSNYAKSGTGARAQLRVLLSHLAGARLAGGSGREISLGGNRNSNCSLRKESTTCREFLSRAGRALLPSHPLLSSRSSGPFRLVRSRAVISSSSRETQLKRNNRARGIAKVEKDRFTSAPFWFSSSAPLLLPPSAFRRGKCLRARYISATARY